VEMKFVRGMVENRKQSVEQHSLQLSSRFG
jgi:hypothetical protein